MRIHPRRRTKRSATTTFTATTSSSTTTDQSRRSVARGGICRVYRGFWRGPIARRVTCADFNSSTGDVIIALRTCSTPPSSWTVSPSAPHFAPPSRTGRAADEEALLWVGTVVERNGKVAENESLYLLACNTSPIHVPHQLYANPVKHTDTMSLNPRTHHRSHPLFAPPLPPLSPFSAAADVPDVKSRS